MLASGLNDRGQLGFGPDAPEEETIFRPVPVAGNVIAVAAGSWHSLALTDDGTVWAWGDGSEGQLGLGPRDAHETYPCPVRALEGVKIEKITAGANHTLAVDSTGRVFSWGADPCGCLGHGQASGRNYASKDLFNWFAAGRGGEVYPRVISRLETLKITDVAAGHVHSLALSSDGALFSWGEGRAQQLGYVLPETDRPMRVSIPPISKIAAGGTHSLALSCAGKLLSWGANQNGVLGLGHRKEPQRGTISTVDLTVSKFACGWKHSLAADGRGKLWAWGWGGSQGDSAVGGGDGGQLGVGNAFDYWAPTQVRGLQAHDDGPIIDVGPSQEPLWKARSLSAGMLHSAAVIEVPPNLL